jgi:hypothetical protein
MICSRSNTTTILGLITSDKVYADLGLTNSENEVARTDNKGFAIAGGQWFIEVLCFHFTFVLAESLVLRNTRHSEAENRV